MKFIVCKTARNEEGLVIPGEELGKYESPMMLAPGMDIVFQGKKIIIKSIETRENGTKLLLVESFRKGR